MTVLVCRFAPWAGVKLKVTCVSERGVEKPVTASSKPEALRVAMFSRVMAGLRRLSVKVWLTGGNGVAGLPPL